MYVDENRNKEKNQSLACRQGVMLNIFIVINL